jgi:hypothetical protein
MQVFWENGPGSLGKWDLDFRHLYKFPAILESCQPSLSLEKVAGETEVLWGSLWGHIEKAAVERESVHPGLCLALAWPHENVLRFPCVVSLSNVDLFFLSLLDEVNHFSLFFLSSSKSTGLCIWTFPHRKNLGSVLKRNGHFYLVLLLPVFH